MDKIGDYMNSPVLTTNPDSFVQGEVQYMYEKNVGALLVTENDKFVGIITKKDWIHKVLIIDEDPNNIRVSSIMTAPIITADVDEPLSRASEIMEEHQIRHIAVTDQEKIIGILSIKDLERYYLDLGQRKS